MGKINTDFKVDLLQLLNIALAERAEEIAHIVGDSRFFVHSPSQDSFEVRSLEGPVAVFSMKELPGCCGVVVSYHASVVEPLRKKGLGSILLECRMSAARRQGYGSMIATVVDSNRAERDMLASHGWTEVAEFRNPKTSKLIVTYSVNL